MPTPSDLHPDDMAIRENLRDMLINTRRGKGMSQLDLGDRLNFGSKRTASQMELRAHWKLSTLQRWSAALGQRIIVWPECLPPDDALFLFRPAAAVAAMDYDRRAYIDALADARRWVGLSQLRLANRLGITDVAVAQTERSPDVLLVNAQRYCRAMDSQLSISLEDGPLWQA